MKLVIVGATGRVGRHLVRHAIDAGHDVTVVVRTPEKLGQDAELVTTVTTDLADPDPAALRDAATGAGAVLSSLGPSSQAEAGVATAGTAAVVAAMREAGVARIVAVSAAPVGTVPSPQRPHPPRRDPGDGIVVRALLAPVLKRVLRHHYADLARMEDVVRDSDLDWTVVRPPRLTDKPATGTVRTATGRNIRGGTAVSRGDLARVMVQVLDRPETVRQTLGVAA